MKKKQDRLWDECDTIIADKDLEEFENSITKIGELETIDVSLKYNKVLLML